MRFQKARRIWKKYLKKSIQSEIATGCGEKDPEVEKLKEEIEANQLERRDGLVCLLNQEKPFTGVSVEKYSNGQKKGERTFKDGEEISSKEWNEDGNLIKEE
tara:strand:- start:93 stop:398 length:306 start_codon:yes stop_codon:yes gene_type:complete